MRPTKNAPEWVKDIFVELKGRGMDDQQILSQLKRSPFFSEEWMEGEAEANVISFVSALGVTKVKKAKDDFTFNSEAF